MLAGPIAVLETRIRLLDLAVAGRPVPRFDERQNLLPADLYSSHLNALFPELKSSDPLYAG